MDLEVEGIEPLEWMPSSVITFCASDYAADSLLCDTMQYELSLSDPESTYHYRIQ